MICPSCGFDNIEGEDLCNRCHGDLTNATAANQRNDIEDDLLQRPLGALATDKYIEVPPDRSVREMVRAWHDGGHHCAVVVAGGAIVGIFTERDLLLKLANDYNALADAPVSDFMTRDPVTLKDDVPAAFALNRMMVGGYRHIPLEHDGRLTGVVSVRDILAYLAKRFGDVIRTETPV